MLQSLVSVFGQTYYTYSTPSSSDGTSSVVPMIATIIGLAVLVIVIVSMWKVFTKAGRQGWAAIIPFYNTYTVLKIVGRPGWWFWLYFIPVVNLVISIITFHNLSKSFGKGVGMTLALIFFPFIAFPVLGYGSAKYQGPSAPGASAAAGTPPAAV